MLWPFIAAMKANSTTWVEMSAVFNIKAKHGNDVHDELQQLSLKLLSLFQC